MTTPPQALSIPQRPQFFGALKVPLLLALAVQLLLAPFTSVAPDTAVWLSTSQRSMAGIGLFNLTGFSYPPIYGYWCMALGALSRLVGIQPSSLGGPVPHLHGTWQFSGAFIATNPWFTLALKIPLIAASMLTGYFIWRIVLNLSGTDAQSLRRARFSFLLWSFSPLVLVVGAVHGQIDPLVACAVTGGILYALEDRWALAGVLITFGIAAKITPIFLVPLIFGFALQSKERRWHRLGAFAIGGGITALVTLGPVMGSDFVRNVFTRTSTGGSVGGLGPFGLLVLPLLNREWLLVSHHVALIGQLGLLAATGTSVLGGLWLWKRGQRTSLVVVAIAVMIVVILATPVLNAQYVLWYFPLLVVGASGVLGGKRRWYTVATVTTAVVSPLLVLANFGLSEILAPATAAFGWPTTGSIEHQWWVLYQPHEASTLLPATLVDRIRFVLAVISTAAMVLTLAALWTSLRPSTRRVPRETPHSLWPRNRRMLTAALAAVLVVEAIALSAQFTKSAPVVHSTVRAALSGHAARLTVNTQGDSSLRLVGFAAKNSPANVHIFFYLPTQSDCGATSNAKILGSLQSLQSLLGSRSVTAIDAARFERIIKNPSAARGTVVIDVAGSIPSIIWNQHRSASLTRWMSAGGTLVWAGAVPGSFTPQAASQCGSTVNPLEMLWRAHDSSNALLPLEVIRPVPGWTKSERPSNSKWREALQLSYSTQDYPLSISAIRAHAGIVLGTVDEWNTTNVAYLPLNRGGMLDFAGPTDGDQFGSDLAKLLRGGVLSAQGEPKETTTQSQTTTMTVSVPQGSTAVDLLAMETNPTAIWLDRKVHPWPTH